MSTKIPRYTRKVPVFLLLDKIGNPVGLMGPGTNAELLEIGSMGEANWPLDNSVSPACAYPLNADETEILLLNSLGQFATGRADFDETEQNASYTIQGELANTERFWGAPANFTIGAAETFAVGSDKKAIQFRLAVDEMVSEGVSSRAEINISVASAAFAIALEVRLKWGIGIDGTKLEIRNGTTYVFSEEGGAASVLVTVEFNDDGTFSARRNGELLSLTGSTAFTPGEKLIAVSFTENADLTGNAGKILTAEVRTAASSIEGNVSAGFTDICGNLLGTSLPEVSAPAILTVTDDAPTRYYGSNRYGPKSDTTPGVYHFGLLMSDGLTVIPLPLSGINRDEFAKIFTASEPELIDGAITIDLFKSQFFSCDLDENKDLIFDTQGSYGNSGLWRLRVHQTGDGGYTLTLPDNFRKTADSETAIQTDPGSYSMIEFMTFDGGVRYEYRIVHLAADPD